ncbi:MAG: ferrous iron transport protein B [Proteiniphilum sp.]|jgi:ferrous iron transport protein B|uniref:ferrous iron transport protein B n=1 Tax=Proteiniphilum sp. TaxID=1926877 RepID=UPI002B1EBE74|nr:ferrous iron transport protein B [Proteiniphilum sp.]MEA5062126.1 ferrous iron transport protein B [Petrimonas sp.]MEA5128957.1 ferrous iron transport protein B [Proteiniphilum sp.]
MEVKNSCEACPIYHRENLTRLGVDLENADYVITLAGNPNTGKSTVFNNLTGLRQHTGNWPGKTVTRAEGAYSYNEKRYKVVDLPGTYSLLSTSVDEEVARDFILFGRPNVTVIVADATRLERNLNLALQILEITDRAVLCVNLMDEARRNHIEINVRALSRELGIPVITASARSKQGMQELLSAIEEVASGKYVCKPRRTKSQPANLKHAISVIAEKINGVFPDLPNVNWVVLRLLEGDQSIINAIHSGDLGSLKQDLPSTVSEEEGGKNAGLASEKEREEILSAANAERWDLGLNFHDTVIETIYSEASAVARKTVFLSGDKPPYSLDLKIDKIVTGKWTGFPIMFLLLAGVFWITISGANYPSGLLFSLLVDKLHPLLNGWAQAAHFPWWLSGVLIDGAYLSMAWVISVMLPPMAIFFPLFTLLEDFGYLPRVAFNMDSLFRKAGAHGKQALTMSMGFGCNAAGVVAARVIDSPRERLIAIITNNFSLCNGRWPTQILIATIFIGTAVPAAMAGIVSAAAVVSVALLGIFLSLVVSWGLSKTVLKGEASTFSLELPPYRPPRIWQTLYTSLIDRTIFVLWRAMVFAVPAGILIWLVANVTINGVSLAEYFIDWANPFAFVFGLNGIILLAYIIAIPANEIVIPTILMLTVLMTGITGVGAGAGVMIDNASISQTGDILHAGGWTTLTAVNLMLFSLLHNPCSTTIFTIYKETKSLKWTMVSTFLPLALGFAVCFFTTHIWFLIHPMS